jgi:preprotein translocase subunit SecA
VRLLEPGIIKLHRLLGVDELRPVDDAEMLTHLAAALESREFSLDTSSTGDQRVLARITVGGLLREYDQLSGASAGAGLQFEAFDGIYGLEVVPIPASSPVDDPGGPVRDPDALEEVLRFQQALDFQREEMLAWRAPFLTSDDPSALVEGVISDFVKGGMQLLPRRYDKYDVRVALDAVRDHCPLTITVPELMRADGRNAVIRAVLDDALEAYRRRAREFDTEQLQDLARKVLLSAADRAWRRHLRREEALPASLRLLDARGDDPVDTYEEALAESSILMTDEFTIEVVGYMSYLNLEWEGL